eukprot:1859235-Amphidinium_carterae.1
MTFLRPNRTLSLSEPCPGIHPSPILPHFGWRRPVVVAKRQIALSRQRGTTKADCQSSTTCQTKCSQIYSKSHSSASSNMCACLIHSTTCKESINQKLAKLRSLMLHLRCLEMPTYAEDLLNADLQSVPQDR